VLPAEGLTDTVAVSNSCSWRFSVFDLVRATAEAAALLSGGAASTFAADFAARGLCLVHALLSLGYIVPVDMFQIGPLRVIQERSLRVNQ
jgi:hypothetical protein